MTDFGEYQTIRNNPDIALLKMSPILGTYNTPLASSNDIEIAGNIAYIANKEGGLRVVNITDPTNPIEIGFFNLTGDDDIMYVEIAGDIAYLTNYTHLFSLNISDPTNPHLITVLSISGANKRDMVVAGNVLYLSGYTGGLRSISILDPANPIVLHTLGISTIAQDVSGDLDVVLATNMIALVNISNPSSMTQISSIPFSNTFVSGFVKIHGDIAYVGLVGIGGGLLAIDISDPFQPIVVFNDTTYTNLENMAISGNLAYVACQLTGLKCFDITTSSHPLELETLGGIGSVKDVEVSGDVAYTLSFDALRCIKVSDLIPPISESYYDLAGSAGWRIAVVGDIAYVGTLSGNFLTVNISDPIASPTLSLLDNIALPSQPTGIAIAGDVAYLSAISTGFITVNISDPTNLVVLNTTTLVGATYSVAVDGNVAYVGNTIGGLYAFSIFDPVHPILLDNNALGGGVQINDLALSGNIAYLAANSNGLIVVNITDPTNLIELTRLTTGLSDAEDIVVSGNVAYLVNATGLVGIDITNPADPSIIGYLATNSTDYAVGVDVSGDLVCVSDSGAGLWCIDVSDPRNPVKAGYIDTSYAYRVDIEGDFAFIADSTYDIRSIRIRQAGTYDKDNDTLSYIKEFWELNTDPNKDNRPWSSHPVDDSVLVYSPYTITWYLYDINFTTGGSYRITSNSTVSQDWTSWSNATAINIAADTNTIGTYWYTIEYNNSIGLVGTPDTIWIDVYDNIIPWLETPPTDGSVAYGSSDTIWFYPRDNYAGGYYRILSNQSGAVTGWQTWDNATGHQINVDTTSQLTTWYYTIEFNDSAGNAGTPYTVYRIITDSVNPWDNNPFDLKVPQGATATITWQLYDNVNPNGEGMYRITSNSTVSRDWTSWTYGAAIDIDVDSTIIGPWSYVIEYNDSVGNSNTDEVIVTIYDNTAPTSDNPPDTVYAKDAAANIRWTLSDNYLGGFYRVLRNESLYKDWTPWTSGVPIDIGINATVAGIWNYTIQYNDSLGLWGLPDTVLITIDGVAPWDSNPPNPTYIQGDTGAFTFTLYDDIAGGYYRVLRESVEVQGWQTWTSGISIQIIIDTSAVGSWNYTIQYNDSAGNPGAPLILSVEVQAPGGGIPSFELILVMGALMALITLYRRRSIKC
ncbi:MAG: LVIVD repeat-containing protein [Candidatus Helarchaeota archaeon]